MVFTLQRYVFRELFRVFLLSTIALTLMLSLGSILQPVQKYGVGPKQVLSLMTYFLPVTLTFVLPMSALFASSLVYGRFASDNELTACRASGIHLMTLIYPGLGLAIAVAITTLLLSFHVMPAFVHMAEKSIKADARQILFRNIQRKGSYSLPPDKRYRIYADKVDEDNDTMHGVVVVKLSKRDASVEKLITAEWAQITFDPQEKFSEVQISAYNTYQSDSADEGGAEAKWLSLSLEFGSMLEDEIKFKRLDEIKAIQVDPIKFYPIAKYCREIYAQATAELLAQEISKSIKAGKAYRLHSGGEIVEVMATSCEPSGEKRVGLLGDVVINQYDAETMERTMRLESAKAYLHLEGDDIWPTLTLDVYNARIDGSAYLKMRHLIRGLVLPARVESATARFKDDDGQLKAEELAVAMTELDAGSSGPLVGRQAQLQREMIKTVLEIRAVLHQRLVFGIGCVPMIMIGLGLGIIKREGHVLSAFGISCLPAAMLIVCIMSGKQITENMGSQVSGTMIMWSGLGALCLIAAVVYRKLLKT